MFKSAQVDAGGLTGCVPPELERRIAALEPKQSLLPLRIVFLGESTAAGWLYAPEVTPARMLNAELERACGPRIFEVIDLSAIDLKPWDLVATTDAALALVPDLLLVFAGNNWPMRLPVANDARLADYQNAAAWWTGFGFPGLARAIDDATRALAERVLTRLVELSDRGSAELVLVVPEVNLLDWHRSRPVAWLRGDGVDAWHSLAAHARASLETGDYEAAIAASHRMIELDGGVNPTAHRLLAMARARLGDLDGCRASAVAEVQARSFDNFPSMPGATRTIQEQIRRAAAENDLSLVDLPPLFADAGSGAPPGRRFFLDYCHLTAEGMTAAMKEAARVVLRATDRNTPRNIEPDAPALSVPPSLDARAKFLSGLCAAHWSARESPSLAPSWFDEALATCGDIADEMVLFLSGRAAPAEVLHLSVAEQSVEPTADAATHRMRLATNVDAEVFDWVLDSLERAGVAVDRLALTSQWLQTHGVQSGAVNLAAPLYHHHSFAQLPSGASAFAPAPARYVRSLWPRFDYTLLADALADVEIELVARLAPENGARGAPLQISLNSDPLGSVEVSERWSRHVLWVDRKKLRYGVNRLTLVWPPISVNGDRGVERVERRWREGLPADVHPTFGEVDLLVARAR